MARRLVTGLLWTLAIVLSTRADPRPSYAGHRRPAVSDDRLLDALRARRTHQCTNVYGTCFSSSHCCAGLVCASNDDNIDLKPETPGYCVKEKDLQSCDDSTDCPDGSRCLPLGRSTEFYCAPASISSQRPAAISSVPIGSEPGPSAPRVVKLGGLGSPCQTSAECAAYTADESSRLCCQDVHRFRQPTRRQCDRYRENISVCIGSDRR